MTFRQYLLPECIGLQQPGREMLPIKMFSFSASVCRTHSMWTIKNRQNPSQKQANWPLAIGYLSALLALPALRTDIKFLRNHAHYRDNRRKQQGVHHLVKIGSFPDHDDERGDDQSDHCVG